MEKLTTFFQKNNVAKLIFFMCFAIISTSCYLRTIKKDLDFKVFHQAAERVVQGSTDFYNIKRDKTFTYKYSPSFPLYIAPLGYFDIKTAQKVWSLVSVFSFIVAWILAIKLFHLYYPSSRYSYMAQLLTLLLLAQPIVNNAIQGNINSIIFAFMMISLHLHHHKKFKRAALLASLAFSIKVTPGILFPYFLLRRDWKSFFYSFLFSVILLILLPLAYYGPELTLKLFNEWRHVLGDTNHFPFYKYTNQSPFVVFYHLTQSKVISYIIHYSTVLLFSSSFLYLTWKKKEILSICFIFFTFLVATPVSWIDYYLCLVFPTYYGCLLLLEKKITNIGRVLWGVKIIFSHLLVQFIITKTYSVKMAYIGQHLWGLFLLTVIVTLANTSQSQNHNKNISTY